MNDREDDFLQEKDSLIIMSQTKIRQRRDNIYADFELMEARVRIRNEAELKAEREKAEVYHKMDID